MGPKVKVIAVIQMQEDGDCKFLTKLKSWDMTELWTLVTATAQDAAIMTYQQVSLPS